MLSSSRQPSRNDIVNILLNTDISGQNTLRWKHYHRPASIEINTGNLEHTVPHGSWFIISELIGADSASLGGQWSPEAMGHLQSVAWTCIGLAKEEGGQSVVSREELNENLASWEKTYCKYNSLQQILDLLQEEGAIVEMDEHRILFDSRQLERFASHAEIEYAMKNAKRLFEAYGQRNESNTLLTVNKENVRIRCTFPPDETTYRLFERKGFVVRQEGDVLTFDLARLKDMEQSFGQGHGMGK